MKRKRRTFSREYKLAAVKKVVKQGLSCRQVARDLEIRDSLIRKWRKAFEADGTLKAEIDSNPSVESELKRLREECHQLKMERDILPLDLSIPRCHIFTHLSIYGNFFGQKQGAHPSRSLLQSKKITSVQSLQFSAQAYPGYSVVVADSVDVVDYAEGLENALFTRRQLFESVSRRKAFLLADSINGWYQSGWRIGTVFHSGTATLPFGLRISPVIGRTDSNHRFVFTRGNDDYGANSLIYAYPGENVVIIVLSHAGQKNDALSYSRAVHAVIERLKFPGTMRPIFIWCIGTIRIPIIGGYLRRAQNVRVFGNQIKRD